VVGWVGGAGGWMGVEVVVRRWVGGWVRGCMVAVRCHAWGRNLGGRDR
jgi:hypothetical protein